MLPAIVAPGVVTAGDTINVPWGKLPLELQAFPTSCAVSKGHFSTAPKRGRIIYPASIPDASLLLVIR